MKSKSDFHLKDQKHINKVGELNLQKLGNSYSLIHSLTPILVITVFLLFLVTLRNTRLESNHILRRGAPKQPDVGAATHHVIPT